MAAGSWLYDGSAAPCVGPRWSRRPMVRCLPVGDAVSTVVEPGETKMAATQEMPNRTRSTPTPVAFGHRESRRRPLVGDEVAERHLKRANASIMAAVSE